jgi:hypothetical protein
MLIIGMIIGAVIGMTLMGLMAASSRRSRCEECRRRESKEGGGYHIGSHKEFF